MDDTELQVFNDDLTSRLDYLKEDLRNEIKDQGESFGRLVMTLNNRVVDLSQAVRDLEDRIFRIEANKP